MIYRIEIRDDTHTMGCGERTAGDIMEHMGLEIPPVETFIKNAECWFTEAGWQRFGKPAYEAQLREMAAMWDIGQTEDERLVLTVACMPDPNRILHIDEHQVVVRTKLLPSRGSHDQRR
jgi:hypothetical protein